MQIDMWLPWVAFWRLRRSPGETTYHPTVSYITGSNSVARKWKTSPRAPVQFAVARGLGRAATQSLSLPTSHRLPPTFATPSARVTYHQSFGPPALSASSLHQASNGCRPCPWERSRAPEIYVRLFGKPQLSDEPRTTLDRSASLSPSSSPLARSPATRGFTAAMADGCIHAFPKGVVDGACCTVSAASLASRICLASGPPWPYNWRRPLVGFFLLRCAILLLTFCRK